MKQVCFTLWLAALSLALGLTVTGCSSDPPTHLVGDDCSRAAVPATATEDTATFGPLTLDVPHGWYPVQSCSMNLSGLNAPLGFITSRPPVAQCRSGRRPGEIGCGAPVMGLGENDILVEVLVATPLRGPFHANTVVAGRPALLTVKKSAQAEGRRVILTALIRGSVHHKVRDYILVSGSLPAGSLGDQDRVLEMLHTARYLG